MQSFMSVAGGGILLRAHPAAELDIFLIKELPAMLRTCPGFLIIMNTYYYLRDCTLIFSLQNSVG